ncbi:MAG: cell division protein FtsW (lipid II flippase) [Saprospiraceae bacterium]|jgi:cell division protein FtsW (lipid II flippase)
MSESTLKKTQSTNLVSSILLILLSVLIWWQSDSFPGLQEGYPGPNLFPRIIALGLGGIGILLFYSGYKTTSLNSNTKSKLGSREILRPALAIAIVAFFPIISPILGFSLTLLIVTILMGFVFNLHWRKASLTGLITVGIIYFIFSQLLSVLI